MAYPPPRLSTLATLVINVADYGAVGDGHIAYHATISASAPSSLTIDPGNINSFQAGDAGKPIWVTPMSPYVEFNSTWATTIASVTSPTSVTLAANSPACVQGTSLSVVWGTDDTAAIQSAVDAARDPVGANSGDVTLMFDNHGGDGAVYCVTKTIDFGTAFSGGRITCNGYGACVPDYTNINPAAKPTQERYHNVSIRWLGNLATPQVVSSITANGTTAAATTSAPHGFTTGMFVTVAGIPAGNAPYNGTFIVTVTGASTFTYTMNDAPASSSVSGSFSATQEQPTFFFRDDCENVRVENLGFFGGDKALLFRPLGNTSLDKVSVDNCQFDAMRTAAIFIGRDFDDPNDNDMADYSITRCMFDVDCNNGIQANIASNGYGLVIEDCEIFNMVQPQSRGVYVKYWNDVAIRNIICSVGDYPTYNGNYLFQMTEVNGFLDVENVYHEGELLLQALVNGVGMNGALLTNIYINSDSTHFASQPAIDITGYAVYVNVGVSTYKGTPQQRTINTTAGCVTIGNNQGQLTDNYTGGSILKIGAITGSPSYQLSVPTGIVEHARKTPLGEWIPGGTPTLSTATTATWSAGTTITFQYTLIGKTMIVSFCLNGTSLSAGTNSLQIAIPGSYVAAQFMANPFNYSDNGNPATTGVAEVNAGGTTINLFHADQTSYWAASSGATSVMGTISFAIQ